MLLLLLLFTRRLYDVHSGEMVWSYDEHESTKTKLWKVEGPVPMVGLWTEDGLWIIRVSVFIELYSGMLSVFMTYP